MTSDVRSNAIDELGVADEELAVAALLLSNARPRQAASRIYYAAFHAARALLFSIGVDPRSHEAVRALLAQHFIRTGKLPKETGKVLPQLEGLRLAGDYDSVFTSGVAELEPELERARHFVAAARAALAAPP